MAPCPGPNSPLRTASASDKERGEEKGGREGGREGKGEGGREGGKRGERGRNKPCSAVEQLSSCVNNLVHLEMSQRSRFEVLCNVKCKPYTSTHTHTQNTCVYE